jgi:hypothetical protein
MPDEEPIFRRWDAAPSEPPPILQEQPMLRYMQQESRVAPSTGSYGRRRRPAEPSGRGYREPDYSEPDYREPDYREPDYREPDYRGSGYGPSGGSRRRYPDDEPSGRVAPAPRGPYPPREEYPPDAERDYRQSDYAGPPPGSVRPRRPEDSGGMRPVRPDTTGSMPRIRRPDTTESSPRVRRPDTTDSRARIGAADIPAESPTSGRPGRAGDTGGGMRTVRPDTTGSQPRISASGSSRVTTGGQPRISAPTASEPTRGGGAMRAVRPDTGEHPRMSASTAESWRTRSESVSGPPSGASYSASRRGGDTSAGATRSSGLSLTTMVGVVVLLAVVGAAAFFLFRDNASGKTNNDAQNTGVQSSAKPSGRDISNRQADPAPLTEAEVFPGPQVTGQPPYQVLKTQATTDCGVAAVDDLGRMLTQNGCTQVVRATLKSGDGGYLITAGIFNLADTQSALASHENIKPTVDAQKGRFTGLLAGPGTEALVRAPMILGWHARGHFLAYCVIARADGNGFEAGDQRPNAIQTDILTTYLRDSVIGGRAVQGAGASAPVVQQSAPAASPQPPTG